MEHIPIKIFRNDNGQKVMLPSYMSEHAAGMDVCAAEHICIDPGKTALVKTGLFVEIPIGYELQVRPRSGLALKHSLLIPNAPGTIDADFRGEIGVIVLNAGVQSFTIDPGDRIAQLVLNKVYHVTWQECECYESLQSTERGEGGFGHTGA